MRKSSTIPAVSDPKGNEGDDGCSSNSLPRSHSLPGSVEDDRQGSAPPAPKRQKAEGCADTQSHDLSATSNQHSPLPKLTTLSQMPLDVLLEIFNSLSPIDLLSLSHTARSLCKALLSRSSSSVWKTVYARAAKDSLPPLSDDIPIPHLLSLAYDGRCHFCHGPSINTVFWAARLRCCKKCFTNKNNFMSEAATMADAQVGLRDMIEKSQYDLGLCLPRITVQVTKRCTRSSYPTAHVRRFFEEYERDGMERKDFAARCEWLSLKSERFGKILLHQEQCDAWRKKVRKMELQGIVDARKSEIARRLTELGLGEEVEKNCKLFDEHKDVCKSQPLTEKMWSQIKGPLVAYMEDLREKRVTRLRYNLIAQVYREYCLDKPIRTVLPGIGDILRIRDINNIVAGTPWTDDLPKDVVRAKIDAIPQWYFDDWRKKCDAYLVDLLNSVTRKKRATEADLKLATTVFTNDRAYSGPIHFPYPLVLVNPELTSKRYVYHGYGWDLDQDEEDPRLTVCGHVDWETASGLLSPDPARSEVAEQLVIQAGLDPKKATPEDMDELDPWYRDERDYDYRHGSGQTWCAMSWRNMLCLCMNPAAVEILGEAETALARNTFAAENKCQRFGGEDAMCTHCSKRFSDSDHLAKHLGRRHGITAPTKKDYTLGFHGDEGRGEYIYLP